MSHPQEAPASRPDAAARNLTKHLNVYANPSQVAAVKASSRRLMLSVSSYVRLCLDRSPEELAALSSTEAFRLEASRGGMKTLQTRLDEESYGRLRMAASEKGLNLSDFARGVILSHDVFPDEHDGCLPGIVPEEKTYYVYRDDPLAEAFDSLASQTRDVGYLIDNSLYALNTIKKRRSMSAPKVESLLEVTIERLKRAQGMYESVVSDLEAIAQNLPPRNPSRRKR